MTQAPGKPDALQALRARNNLVQAVRALLKGTGLEIRERERELVIRNPRDPDKGRVYITYATGEISLLRTVADYWGYLDGHGRPLWADPETEPGIEAGQIIGTLGGRLPGS